MLLLVSLTEVQATHLRAGDITAKRDTTPNPNPFRYFFRMVIYTDRSSSAEDLTITVDHGYPDSKVTLPRGPVTQISPETDREVFEWEHTFPAIGTYTISWVGVNRNGRILNLQAPSDMHSFYLATTINISPFRGYNSTPVFNYPPIDIANVGEKFVHNPAAFDAEGDSLVFKLVPPRRKDANSDNIIPVPGFTLPNNLFGCPNSTDSGPATFTLDPHTGQMEWDAPCRAGEYNVAFVVEEWRVVPGGGAVKIGEVVRDMQITVKEGPNRPPVLERKDTCIVAGTTLDWVVRATDPDNDLILLSAISGIIPPATFRPRPSNASTGGLALGDFSWSTTCEDVRAQPYLVVFRAEDVRQTATNRLVDLQPWTIRVVGPPPQNLKVAGQGKNVQVTWDSYQCQNASTIRIYRREGPSNFTPDECETGVPASTGYQMIGEVPKDATSFLDTNGGQGLESGKEYCYIIYAEFPAPGRGQSLASVEACITIEQDIPFLTNVTVDETDATAGQITVKWTQPGPGIALLTAPFQYRLYRKNGQEPGTAYTLLTTINNLEDTTFVDTNLNTQDNAYRYKLEFYQSAAPGGPPTVLYDSTSASSVRLEAIASDTDEKFITLNWTYDVPWRNEVLQHKIYRQIDGVFVLIDSVSATSSSGTYTDRGTFNNIALARGESYCYYVQTVGTYENESLPEPLLNNSQEVCAMMPKLICAPELSIDALDCNLFLQSPTQPPYQNVLTWEPNITGDCTDEIDFYTVYFKPTLDAEYVSLGTTTETTFIHTNLESFAGCYKVTATDVNGRVSDFSNEVCKDNCFSFMLPNIITPNGDGKNDVFRPDSKTVFVRSMKFRVFNRWGVQVYEGNDRNINWAGVTTDGGRVPDGTYYYEAEVEFFSLDPARQRATYKGWVQIVR
ncbi:T9SS type B sorting domain-containing protein [Botryobacter ruber]|uniref:T9SS type B sorting domain-containing protein n=1 Tax=Botryobacter ruber TaxID=2171629 RepID=UPI001F0BEA7C|nr:gliding motility-associated C-terminal domain-containing protein [Botryobacter ruber]